MAIKIVVTGGAGFIGSHIVDAYVEKGFDVHIIDNLRGGIKEHCNLKAKFHNKDIRDPSDIQSIIAGAQFVFHTAALPRVQYSIEHPDETHAVNVTGTLNMLIAAQNGNVKKVIYSASSSAYGDQKKMPLREEMEAKPKSPYGLQKYMGELLCQTWSEVYGLPTVSLRYFNVYGPRQNPDGAYALVIGKFLKQKSEGKPLTITGDGEQTRDFTHVKDVVSANILAAESDAVGKGEVFNIGAGKNFSVNQVAKLIGGPTEHVSARLEPKDTLADNTRAKKMLGWEPKITLEDGIAELQV
jgi:UDP-glucose 4-epimerase